MTLIIVIYCMLFHSSIENSRSQTVYNSISLVVVDLMLFSFQQNTYLLVALKGHHGLNQTIDYSR